MVRVDGYAAEEVEGCVPGIATPVAFMKLPGMMDDDHWKNLGLKKTETLGEDPTLDPQMKLVYHTIRELDQRSEWSCIQIVKQNNRQIVVMVGLALLLLASGPQVMKVLSGIVSILL